MVCEVNEGVAGFVVAYRKGCKAYIESLAVSNKYRGLGIGTRLISELEGLLVDKRVNSVYLSVKNWNTSALNFYLSRGYGIRGIVLLMCAKPIDVDTATGAPEPYIASDLAAGRVRIHISKPLAWWGNLVDDIDRFIYRKFYKEERTLVVKKNGTVKALATYTINHELVIDSLVLSSYNALEAFVTILRYLKNFALASGSHTIEIPVDASKRRLVMLLKKVGFKVCEVEYLLSKELT